MLKHVKYTIFYKNLNFLEEFVLFFPSFILYRLFMTHEINFLNSSLPYDPAIDPLKPSKQQISELFQD